MRKQSRAGFALIELVLILLTIIFLYYLMSKFYFKRPLLNKEVEQTLVHQGIDTTNYKTILDSTKAKLANIRKQQAEQE
ncbi:MAG: hypothetical protein NTY34_01470 [Candidatus Omnitrophica bacterium]|nr:hypothetical protein [Candidatus Omnitrophota bacterium]